MGSADDWEGGCRTVPLQMSFGRKLGIGILVKLYVSKSIEYKICA
jgi:hypothetical protein